MASERRSAVAGILIFVILVVGGYVAVREVASAELSNVTRPRPISLPTPSITVPQLNTQ
jgi:hypothetical protein